jgi:formate dehydrogenase subunit gamma
MGLEGGLEPGVDGGLALGLKLSWCSPALAEQPSSVNPTAQSVKEQDLLKELHKVQGRGSIPDTKSYVSMALSVSSIG